MGALIKDKANSKLYYYRFSIKIPSSLIIPFFTLHMISMNSSLELIEILLTQVILIIYPLNVY